MLRSKQLLFISSCAVILFLCFLYIEHTQSEALHNNKNNEEIIALQRKQRQFLRKGNSNIIFKHRDYAMENEERLVNTTENGLLYFYPVSGVKEGGNAINFIYAFRDKPKGYEMYTRRESDNFFMWCVVNGEKVKPKSITHKWVGYYIIRCDVPPSNDTVFPSRVDVGIYTNESGTVRLPHLGVTKYTYYNHKEDIMLPKYRLSMCAIVYNASSFIREWIAYHKLLLGAQKFYLYDQMGMDPLLPGVLTDYLASDVVDIIPWTTWMAPSLRHQPPAYWHCMKVFGENSSDWMALIDADEFILPMDTHRPQSNFTKGFNVTANLAEFDYENGETEISKTGYFDLPTYLDRFKSYGALTVDRVTFGSNGHRTKPPGLVIESYTKRVAKNNEYVKSIVKPEMITDFGCDIHTYIPKGVDATYHRRGMHCGNPADRWPVSNIIRINHYWSKSIEEFRERFKLDSNPWEPGAYKWRDNQCNLEDTLMLPLANLIRKEVNKLIDNTKDYLTREYTEWGAFYRQ